MEANSSKSSRVRRSASEIRALLKEKEQSNVSVKEFCEIYDIHEATFYNWKKRYDTKAEHSSVGGFIPMQISEPVTDISLFAEIELPGKMTIRIFRKVDPCYFKALL